MVAPGGEIILENYQSSFYLGEVVMVVPKLHIYPIGIDDLSAHRRFWHPESRSDETGQIYYALSRNNLASSGQVVHLM